MSQFLFNYLSPPSGFPLNYYVIHLPLLRVVDKFDFALPSASRLVSSDGRAAAPERRWSRVRVPDQDEFFFNCEAFFPGTRLLHLGECLSFPLFTYLHLADFC